MSTVARLEVDNLVLAAGGQATLPLEIRNTGEFVEEYRLEIVGVPGQWTSIADPEFTLYPGTSTVTTLTVEPPRSSAVPAGEQRFGIKVTPTDHPDEAVVPEAVVEILPFLETTAELVPRTSRGRFSGKHEVAVDNRGNVPVTVFIAVTDPGELLRLDESAKDALTVAPGQAQFAKVKVTPVERLWRGPTKTIPFTATVSPQDGLPVTLDGSHLQEPIIPPWLGKALLALLALLVALAAIWFLLLKPTVQAAAKEAAIEVANEPVKQAQAQASQAAVQAAKANEAAQAAQAAQAGAAGAAKAADTSKQAVAKAVAGPLPPKILTAPFSGRLAVATAAGQTRTATFNVPKNQSLSLTDLVLENPQGDEGLLRVSIDDATVLEQALESFRTTDYHFISPFVATENSGVTLTVICRRAGTPADVTPANTTCSNGLTFGGPVTTTTPPTPAPAPAPAVKP